MFVCSSLRERKIKFLEPAEVAYVQCRQNRAAANRVRCDHTIDVTAWAAPGSIEQFACELGVLFSERLDAAE